MNKSGDDSISILDELRGNNDTSGKVVGVASGIVTNNNDPDGLGRIKIKFPWLSDNNETDWVRMSTLMAGAGRGSFFLPEAGDEVLVAFEHGNIDCPYVIGALWNGVSAPPETNSDGNNNIRKIKSRSGHEIILHDEEGHEKVDIHSNAGHKVVLDDTSDAKKVEIQTSAGNKITLDDTSGSEKIEIQTIAGRKIALDDTSGSEKIGMQSSAGHKVTLNDALGSEKIEIVDKTGSNSIIIDSVQNSISMQSSMQLKIKANMIEIEADSMMTIKAGAVLTLQGSLVKIN